MTSKRLRVRYADDAREEWPIDSDCLQRRQCARPHLQQSTFCYPRLRARHFWSAQDAGIPVQELCAELEANFDAILGEARATLGPLLGDNEDEDDAHNHAACWLPHGEGLHCGCWLRCFLWACGVQNTQNASAFPTLTAVLNGARAVMRDPPGRCYLSLMLAGTSVRPHCGPTNHRLRLHLPLMLPQTQRALAIIVGGERREWELGRCLVFDDSFEHAVDFPGGQLAPSASPSRSSPLMVSPRLVLVVDVWHPDAESLVPFDLRR